MWPYGWSRDGSWMVVGDSADNTAMDILRFDRETKALTPLVQTPFDDLLGTLSPDEQWMAHVSDQTGRREIHVTSLSGDTGRWQISVQGGTMPGGQQFVVDVLKERRTTLLTLVTNWTTSAPGR